MTNRERFKAIITGRSADQHLAVFRLEPWFRSAQSKGALPAELRHLSLEQVEDHLGLGRSARKGKVFDAQLRPPVECRETRTGDELVTEWRTPRGHLRMVRRYGPDDEAAGLSPSIVEYPIKTKNDYAAYEQIVRHTEYIPAYDAFTRYDQSIGPSGLPMVILGANPFHDLLMRWTGYERGFMDLFDHPDAILSAVEAGNESHQKMWRVVADSPAELVMYGVNFDTAVIPPDLFREHFLPVLAEFNRRMHTAGKRTAFHADGDLIGLLELLRDAGYDVADCFACKPMVRCSLAQARDAWKKQITLWGGIPSMLLEPNVPLDQLRRHLTDLFATLAPDDRFILALADQAMPGADWDHIQLAAKFILSDEAGKTAEKPQKIR